MQRGDSILTLKYLSHEEYAFVMKVYDAIDNADVLPEAIGCEIANYRDVPTLDRTILDDISFEDIRLRSEVIDTWGELLDDKAAALGRDKAMLLMGESHKTREKGFYDMNEHTDFLIKHMAELKAKGITSIALELPHDRQGFSFYDATLDYHAFIDIEEELRSRIRDLNLKPGDDPALSKFLEELDAVSRQVDETYALKSENNSGKKNYETLRPHNFDMLEHSAYQHGLKTFRIDVDSHRHQKFLEVFNCLGLLNKVEQEFPDSRALKLIKKSLYEIKDRLMKERDFEMALQLSMLVEPQSKGHILGLFGSNHLRRERQGYYEFPSVTDNLESWGQAVVTVSAANNLRDRSSAVGQPGFNLVDTINNMELSSGQREVVITGERDELDSFDAIFTRLNTVVEHD